MSDKHLAFQQRFWSLDAVAQAIGSTPQQVVALTMLGWLPPAVEMREGVLYWSDAASDAVAEAYGEWLAYRSAHDQAVTVSEVLLGRLRQAA